MRVFDSTGLKMLAAATMTLAAGMAMPMFAPAQATPEMKVAMAMPMHHHGSGPACGRCGTMPPKAMTGTA
ncbi:MAG TPA: hypothetical protein VE221_02730 [Sphingomicrobium sp.]|nr:hypothetical protein [Sphingomicrobium sp.]